MESTEAILLRKRKFSDTSLIVSWCTELIGCIQTIAKGARRPKSPFAGKLDLFFEAEISIVRSRKTDLHTLAEVVLKNPFAGIRSSYRRTQTAAYRRRARSTTTRGRPGVCTGEFVRAIASFPHTALENTRDGGEKHLEMRIGNIIAVFVIGGLGV